MKHILLNKSVLSWALYDWANSAFATTIVAGFFPVFYNSLTQELSTADAQYWFNITLALGSILIAIAAPILGAIADQGGNRKKMLASFALLGILMSASLAWVGAGMWWVGLLIYGLGQIGFSGANIFYDALIVKVSSDEDIDIVSGYGYALGYIGGGLLFLINVLMVTKPELFGIVEVSTALSFSFISVAVWWAAFTIPLLLYVEEEKSSTPTNVSQTLKLSFAQLRNTFSEIKKYRGAMIFLMGYWLYIDGVGTIYKMAVFFANRVLSLPQESLITALLLTQFVAFPAALAFGWLGKRIGPKPGILIGLAVYTLVILYAWGWLETSTDFYKLAVTIGLVQGGVQSLSRSLYARLIPTAMATEFFGFYNMVGKFASILGPLLMAIVPILFVQVSERDSILVLLVLFISGAWVLSKVDVAKGTEQANNIDLQIKAAASEIKHKNKLV